MPQRSPSPACGRLRGRVGEGALRYKLGTRFQAPSLALPRKRGRDMLRQVETHSPIFAQSDFFTAS